MSRYGESDVSTNEISSGTVDVLAVFGADLTVAVWTASAERLWGWSADEVLHRPLAELLASGGPAPSDLYTGDLWSGRVRVSRRDGREASADLRVVPLSTDGSGGWLVWQPDISARPGLDPATLNTFRGYSHIALAVWDRDLRCLWFNDTVHNQDIYRSGPELGGHDSESMIWATCLYGVYDPATRRCTLASAGHPPPAIVSPEGAVDFADVPPGAPIGVGTGSFKAIEVELAEGSVIALYSDGLIETRCRDVDQGLERLRTALARPVPDMEDLCASVIASLVPGGPSDDDIALLLAKTRTSTPGDRHAP